MAEAIGDKDRKQMVYKDFFFCPRRRTVACFGGLTATYEVSLLPPEDFWVVSSKGFTDCFLRRTFGIPPPEDIRLTPPEDI